MGFFDKLRDRGGGFTLIPRAPLPGTAADLDALGVSATPVLAETGDVPIAWLIPAPADPRSLWQRLMEAFPETGLWPVVAQTLHDTDTRPWLEREFDGPQQVTEDFLAALNTPLAGYGDEPGERPLTAADLANATWRPGPITLPTPRDIPAIALVPATRPADVPAQLGWWGPCNHDLSGGDVSAVLRSWEDRFGAVLTHIGFDTLTLQVADPPGTAADAAALAAEWYAFCPDAVRQGVGTLEKLAAYTRRKIWEFWWD